MAPGLNRWMQQIGQFCQPPYRFCGIANTVTPVFPLTLVSAKILATCGKHFCAGFRFAPPSRASRFPVPNRRHVMRSVYSGGIVRPPPADSSASDGQHLPEGSMRANRERRERVAADDPQRENLVRLGMLIRDLVKARNCSSGAMITARAFCLSCRCLGATHGECSRQPLDRCLLLERTGLRIVHPPFTDALM